MNRRILYVLVATVVLAAWLRLLHFDFGFPYYYHPDERQATLDVARLLDGHAEIKGYKHPPLFRLTAFMAGVLVSPLWGGGVNPELYAHAALRLTSVAFGVLAIPLLYLLGRRFLTPGMSLGAAAVYAVLPLPVFLSKYGAPDSMLACLCIFNLWIQCLLMERGGRWLYGVAGLGLALAFATKYNAVFLAVSFMVAHGLRVRREGWTWRRFLNPGLGLAFGAGLAVGLMAGFPFILTGEWGYLVRDLGFERSHLLEEGHDGIRISGGRYVYLYYFLREILPMAGIPFVVLAVAGVVGWMVRRRREHWVLLAFLAPYYVAMESAYKIPEGAGRYVLPVLPLYVLGVFTVLEWLDGKLAGRGRRMRVVVMVMLVGMVSVYPAYKTSRWLAGMVPDTRETMREWMRENLSPTAVVFVPQWVRSGYYPPLSGLPFRAMLSPRSPEELLRVDRRKITHVLVSSLIYERYIRWPEDSPLLAEYYAELARSEMVQHRVEPAYSTYLVHNPTLILYELRRDGGRGVVQETGGDGER
jgi:hypothetical protein